MSKRLAFLGTLAIVAAACSPPAPPPAAAGAGAATNLPARGTVTGQAPPGTVVTVEPADGPAPLPPGPAVMDQISRTFVPDLLLVRVGQRVEFRNSEDVDHNVAVVRSPTGTRVFDTSTAPFEKYEHTFDRTGRYEVSCDVHPGMRATIVATTAPHALVVDASGRFAFTGLGPGAYTVVASNAVRSAERRVEVADSGLDLGTLTP